MNLPVKELWTAWQDPLNSCSPLIVLLCCPWLLSWPVGSLHYLPRPPGWRTISCKPYTLVLNRLEICCWSSPPHPKQWGKASYSRAITRCRIHREISPAIISTYLFEESEKGEEGTQQPGNEGPGNQGESDKKFTYGENTGYDPGENEGQGSGQEQNQDNNNNSDGEKDNDNNSDGEKDNDNNSDGEKDNDNNSDGEKDNDNNSDGEKDNDNNKDGEKDNDNNSDGERKDKENNKDGDKKDKDK